MVVNEDYFLEDLEISQKNEIEKEKNVIRHERIKFEFNLYKWFCRLNNTKMCDYSSLVDFQNYCKLNFIILL